MDHLLFSRSDLLSVYADMSTCCKVPWWSLEVFSVSDASPVGHPGFKQQRMYGVWVRFFLLRKRLLCVPDCVLSLCWAGNSQASRM